MYLNVLMIPLVAQANWLPDWLNFIAFKGAEPTLTVHTCTPVSAFKATKCPSMLPATTTLAVG